MRLLEDKFCLPLGEGRNPLLLHLVIGLAGASVKHYLAVLLEQLPLQDLGEQVRGILVGRDVYCTLTMPAPRISRSLKSLRLMWRVCCALVYLWHSSYAPLLSVSTNGYSGLLSDFPDGAPLSMRRARG